MPPTGVGQAGNGEDEVKKTGKETFVMKFDKHELWQDSRNWIIRHACGNVNRSTFFTTIKWMRHELANCGEDIESVSMEGFKDK